MFEKHTYILKIYPSTQDDSTPIRDRVYLQRTFVTHGGVVPAKRLSQAFLEDFDNVYIAQLYEPEGPHSMVWTLTGSEWKKVEKPNDQ